MDRELLKKFIETPSPVGREDELIKLVVESIATNAKNIAAIKLSTKINSFVFFIIYFPLKYLYHKNRDRKIFCVRMNDSLN